MRIRPLVLALGAATALTAGALAPAAAAAGGSGVPEPLENIVGPVSRAVTDDACTITGSTPRQVVLGIAPKAVQFGVSTSCDGAGHSMEWAVTGELMGTSAHATWFGACTFTYTGPANLSCPAGQDTLDVTGTGQFRGNTMAGEQKVYAYAFDDANGNNRDDDTKLECDAEGECTRTSSGRDDATATIRLLRRTSWGRDQVSKDVVRTGEQITLASRMTRANWDTGRNEAFGPTVKLQFKPRTSAGFRTVRTVTATGDSTRVTVTARRSGVFRFVYRGDDISAPSVSRGVSILVRP